MIIYLQEGKDKLIFGPEVPYLSEEYVLLYLAQYTEWNKAYLLISQKNYI